MINLIPGDEIMIKGHPESKSCVLFFFEEQKQNWIKIYHLFKDGSCGVLDNHETYPGYFNKVISTGYHYDIHSFTIPQIVNELQQRCKNPLVQEETE